MDRRRRGMRMLIGLWILAGLVTVGINGLALITLLDQPLAGYSDAVRHLNQSIRTYQMHTADKAEKTSFEVEFLSQRFAPKPSKAAIAPVIEQSTPLRSAPKKHRVAPPASLPILSGIVTRRSADGGVGRLAILDKGLFSEGGKVGDFVINQIRADGVRLVRGKNTWFIKAPEITHSVTTR